MKKKANRQGFKIAAIAALATAAAAGAVLVANDQMVSKADDSALVAIREAYKTAMNNAGNPGSNSVSEFIQRHLDASFRGTTVTDTEIKTPQDFIDFTERMKALIGMDRASGPRGRYEIKEINTLARFVAGDTAVSVGTTAESVQGVSPDPKTGQPVLGPELNYKTVWTAVLSKKSGSWKLLWAHNQVVSGDIGENKLKEIKKLAAKAMSPTKGG